MVERIREQQEAINVVLSNDRKVSHFIINWQQKDVLEAIDKLLSPLKKMTDLFWILASRLTTSMMINLH